MADPKITSPYHPFVKVFTPAKDAFSKVYKTPTSKNCLFAAPKKTVYALAAAVTFVAVAVYKTMQNCFYGAKNGGIWVAKGASNAYHAVCNRFKKKSVEHLNTKKDATPPKLPENNQKIQSGEISGETPEGAKTAKSAEGSTGEISDVEEEEGMPGKTPDAEGAKGTTKSSGFSITAPEYEDEEIELVPDQTSIGASKNINRSLDQEVDLTGDPKADAPKDKRSSLLEITELDEPKHETSTGNTQNTKTKGPKKKTAKGSKPSQPYMSSTTDKVTKTTSRLTCCRDKLVNLRDGFLNFFLSPLSRFTSVGNTEMTLNDALTLPKVQEKRVVPEPTVDSDEQPDFVSTLSSLKKRYDTLNNDFSNWKRETRLAKQTLLERLAKMEGTESHKSQQVAYDIWKKAKKEEFSTKLKEVLKAKAEYKQAFQAAKATPQTVASDEQPDLAAPTLSSLKARYDALRKDFQNWQLKIKQTEQAILDSLGKIQDPSLYKNQGVLYRNWLKNQGELSLAKQEELSKARIEYMKAFEAAKAIQQAKRPTSRLFNMTLQPRKINGNKPQPYQPTLQLTPRRTVPLNPNAKPLFHKKYRQEQLHQPQYVAVEV